MRQQLYWEIYKIFKRPRTLIAFGAVAAIVLLIQMALKFDGISYLNLLLVNISDSFNISEDFKRNTLNGYLICFIVLNTILMQMPLLVALIAGDSIAGEANMGTLRLALSTPIGRTRYILIKFLASAFYTLLLLLWLAFLALAGSILLFGVNDLVILKSAGMDVISSSDVLWRYFAAFGFALVALCTIASLAVLLSVFAQNSIGPIMATMSVVIVFTILSQMNIPIFDNTIKPYLFTTHMVAWKGFFYIKSSAEGTSVKGSISNLPAVMKSLGILFAYIGLFLGATIIIFKRKDILS